MSNVHFQQHQKSPNFTRISESTRLLHASATTAKLDASFGFNPVTSGEKVGWLSNIHPTLVPDIDPETGDVRSMNGVSGVDLYWLDLEGGYYKTTKLFKPYLFVLVNENSNNLAANHASSEELDHERVFHGIEQWAKRDIPGLLETKIMPREDLALDNHLTGLQRNVIKLTFGSEIEMNHARFTLTRLIASNKDRFGEDSGHVPRVNFEDFIMDIREYDVPFHTRVMIDLDLRVGKWYVFRDGDYAPYSERDTFPDPVVLAFDIETCKAPLKFPDSDVDPVMMISYMIDGEGFLITNREVISTDIDDFEYTPKPELKGDFTIFNERDEKSMIMKFFAHIQDVQPTIIATFNGDFFDWPFLDKRATINGLSMSEEIGFKLDASTQTYQSPYCCHMDCFQWVTRDSYLPQGSRGLKAVTRLKLGYDPLELDPELMTPYARDQPQKLSEYSVSDAVATYYLYMKYVHPFIFSLCTIIPLNPDETLRKGTGTLCEMLLMVEAYRNNIILPNKHRMPVEKFYDGHLLTNETYSGGKVLSVESGVFRSDLRYHFDVDTAILKEFVGDVEKVVEFFVTVECGKKMSEVRNLDAVKRDIVAQLEALISQPKRFEKPLIYHVDVASMYPNIMITNRLQPDSMKSEHDCAKCDFNELGKSCDRRLEWKWRGEYFSAGHEDYGMIRKQLQQETFQVRKRSKVSSNSSTNFSSNSTNFSSKSSSSSSNNYSSNSSSSSSNNYSSKSSSSSSNSTNFSSGSSSNFSSNYSFCTWDDLSHEEQVSEIKKRLQEYSAKSYRTAKTTKETVRESIVCQRENPFYADTVRSFRDRRYHFKRQAQRYFREYKELPSSEKHLKEETLKKQVLNDSLQLAHKVILNSFYGYVMRKGSRWFSMEMAGITCYTGSKIITMANGVVSKIGRPLELDTDGIWCILPSSFPEDFKIDIGAEKKLTMPFIGSLLNQRVHSIFTNDQYHNSDGSVTRENSILFEVDGPYKAMILPSSQKEGEGIKKRYAVFDEKDKLVELKGFELKRRGELQLVKNFQNDLFKMFLKGDSLESCYQEVAKVADRWLDVIYSRGSNLEDEDLIELICENKSMSKALAEYDGQKSTSITTAKRLGEFLGEEMVKDKGLQVKYIIADRPKNGSTTERAVPVAIFSHEDASVKTRFLKKWLKDASMTSFDPRDIIDWEYYKERLGSTIQKIITIPAALQQVANPVPRVEHPQWLQRRLAEKKYRQTTVADFFSRSGHNSSKSGHNSSKSGQNKGVSGQNNGVSGQNKGVSGQNKGVSSHSDHSSSSTGNSNSHSGGNIIHSDSNNNHSGGNGVSSSHNTNYSSHNTNYSSHSDSNGDSNNHIASSNNHSGSNSHSSHSSGGTDNLSDSNSGSNNHIAHNSDHSASNNNHNTHSNTASNTYSSLPDIEDLTANTHNKTAAKSRLALVNSRKRKLDADETTTTPPAETILFTAKNCPDPLTAYTAFLAYNKQMWAEQARQRQSRSSLFGSASHRLNSSRLNSSRSRFESSLTTNSSKRLAALAQSHAEWLVLGYIPSSSDRNTTTALVFTGHVLAPVTIRTPKTFYIATTDAAFAVDDPETTVVKTTKVPFSSHSSHSSHNSNTSHVFEITTSHEHFETLTKDVYSFIHRHELLENELSSADRLVMRLGNVIKVVDPKKVHSGLKHGFQLSDLDSVEVGSLGERFSDKNLSGSGNYLPNLAVINLSLVVSTLGYTTFSVMSVDPLTLKDVVSVFVLKPSEGSNALNTKFLAEKFGSQHTVSVEQLSNKKKFVSAINKHVSELILQFQSNAVFMVNDASVVADFGAIVSKYPVILTSTVNKPLPVSLQNWSRKLSSTIFRHFSVYKDQYRSLLHISSANRIPVANMANEIRLIDYKFGEKLMKQNYVLDWNLADHEEEEHDNLIASSVLNHRGIYPQVTVLLEIKNQLLNSILLSNLFLTEMDLTTQDDITAQMIAKLAVLRQLVKELYSSEQNYSLLNLLEPWLYSKQSALTSNSLKKLIFQLVSKSKQVLKQQLARDCRIIYSDDSVDSNTILISLDNRFDLKNSITFTNYILDNLPLQNPLLAHISPAPVRMYDLLIFKDINNFTGRYLKNTDSEASRELEYALDSSWVMRESLPEFYRKEYDDWILIVVDCLLKQKTTNSNDISGYTRYFSKDLFSRVERLWQKQKESIIQPALSSHFKTTLLPGIVPNRNNQSPDPLVLLVNLLNEVFTLNTDDLEGRKLRKTLLSLFDIKEFSADGDPPLLQTFNIGHIICGNCFQLQRITNRSIISAGHATHAASDIACSDCHRPFEREVIVNMLLQKAVDLVREHNNQDLKCTKCGSVKEDLMALNCSCSGFYALAADTVHGDLKLLAECSEFMNLGLRDEFEGLL